MNWDAIITFIQLLNYVTAGPVLAIIAFIGLRQIKVSKDSIRINSKRDAYKIAAEQCGNFASKILPLFGKFEEDLKTKNIKFFDKFDIRIERDAINVKLKDAISQKDLKKIYSSEYLSDLLNSLEGYSMYFVQGVAADNVGYFTTGKGYCGIIKELIPLLFHEFKEGYYRNTYQLFLKWNNRVEDERLRMQKKEIEEKLGKNERLSVDISTIGLE